MLQWNDGWLKRIGLRNLNKPDYKLIAECSSFLTGLRVNVGRNNLLQSFSVERHVSRLVIVYHPRYAIRMYLTSPTSDAINYCLNGRRRHSASIIVGHLFTLPTIHNHATPYRSIDPQDLRVFSPGIRTLVSAAGPSARQLKLVDSAHGVAGDFEKSLAAAPTPQQLDSSQRLQL
jgi:hypothetical protein